MELDTMFKYEMDPASIVENFTNDTRSDVAWYDV